MTILERFVQSLAPDETPSLADVQDYIEWQNHRRAVAFAPSREDDVDIRTYLLHLLTLGADQVALQTRVASLKHFYEWAHAGRLIEQNPFEEYDLARILLSNEQLRPRGETLPENPHAREVARLYALNEVAEHLNRAVDVQSALEDTLKTLLKVMGLQAAWASMRFDALREFFSGQDVPAHGFVLAAADGLPPGLERDDRHFLRQPPECHCQRLLRTGRLTRAVNVIECTRLQDSARASGDNQGLRFHASLPLISKGQPLGIINVATTDWQFLTSADLQFLTAVGSQVSAALERAQLYNTVEAQRTRLKRELQVAHQIQAGLLPRAWPDLPRVQFAAAWHSAREVAGDFYDIFQLSPGRRWGLVIGDVADKGAPAALYMAMARSLLRMAASPWHTPAATLTQVNALLGEYSAYEMFTTLFYAVLDPATRVLTYANAGHPPPLVRRATGEIELLPRTGHVIGVLEKMRLTDATFTLALGDALVMYTDGVTEATSPDKLEYGMARLVAALEHAPAFAPKLLAHLESDLAAFTQDTPQSDDVTFFVMTSE